MAGLAPKEVEVVYWKDRHQHLTCDVLLQHLDESKGHPPQLRSIFSTMAWIATPSRRALSKFAVD